MLFFLAPQSTFLTGFRKFKTMLLGSSTGLPNYIMSHLFSIHYTGSQLKKKKKKKRIFGKWINFEIFMYNLCDAVIVESLSLSFRFE